MSYQVLALKYRPHTFEDVIGQSHVTTTLSNAISTNRVAHAILFTGPRGTGKTTIARILARAMNCETGPTTTPCNQCKICRDIIDGHCTDVFEIDGASNNSVDQIRDLRENVTYMPAAASYKIYIIDEVHMLSTAAFNALLKTLEEPPEHVMFIFATTEVHKIPATILSRCQRHDLGRIKSDLIAAHLKQLGIREGFEIAPESLDLIAQEADGSVRDSLSLFDRVLSAADENKISHDRVLNILGVLNRAVMDDISTAILKKDAPALINLIDTVDNTGLDLKKFYTDIILHFRHLNIIKQCGQDTPAVNLAESEKKKLYQLVSNLPGGYISDILHVLLNEESLIRYSSHTRICIEIVLLKLLEISSGAHIDQIIHHLDKLSSQIQEKFPEVRYPEPTAGRSSHNRPEHQPDIPRAEHQPIQSEPVENLPSSEAAPPPETTAQPDDKPVEKGFSAFLSKIQAAHPFVFALISKGRVTEENQKILVELTNCSGFDKKRIKDKQTELIDVCRKITSKDLEIKISSNNNALETESKKKEEMKARQVVLNHPLVVEAQKMFDGKIINY